jgi:hypothetical protein
LEAKNSGTVNKEELPKIAYLFQLRGENLPPKVWNVAVLGKINKIGEIVSQESLTKALERRFAKQFEKKPDLRKLDIRALTEV